MFFKLYFIDEVESIYPKNLNTKVSDKVACTNNADLLKDQSDQDIHCVPFHLVF